MSEWIDCTQTLRAGMAVWPGDPAFELRKACSIGGGDATNSTVLRTSTHTGTHIDAPYHLFEDGSTIDALPLQRLCGRALVVHVAEPRDVLPSDLADQPIEPGDRVLLRTANEQLWSRGEFVESFHALTAESADWLVERQVSLVGIDYLSVDRFDAHDLPAHRRLLPAGVIIVEGLDLSAVPAGRYEMIALPIKLAGADGAPARVMVRRLAD